MKRKSFKKLVLFFLVLPSLSLHAQQAIGNAGGNATGTGGTVAYSVGQVLYTTNNSSSNESVAQGVQQRYQIKTLLGDENFDIILQMAVYPNPTQNNLTLEVQHDNRNNMQYQLLDLTGRLLLSNNIDAKATPIEMTRYAGATYLLKVMQNNKVLKTFKIIKKR